MQINDLTTSNNQKEIDSIDNIENKHIKIYAKKAKPLNQHEKLKQTLKKFILDELSLDWNEDWLVDLPKKWKHCEDILILPSTCFQMPHWTQKSDDIWKCIAECFRVKRVARENRIKSDDFRSPNLELLYGSDSIVTINNNGIKYMFDVTKCMYSWGNITEKLRIAEFDCSNETVVDLYAGIGYFTLVYLVHARAKRLIACEWNPESVKALRNNLKLNGCEGRCEILEGDNRINCPENCADRVNLGLIPSSEPSWSTACRALKKDTGGVLHIHANIDIKNKESKSKIKLDWLEWSEYAKDKIRNLLTECGKENWNVNVKHIEYLKSYGPRVDHIVLDLLCKPS